MPAEPEGEPQADVILAECRAQRRRALRWTAFSGILAVALVAAAVAAAVAGRYHGPIVILVPVLLVLNLVRLAQCVTALGKIRQIGWIVRSNRHV